MIELEPLLRPELSHRDEDGIAVFSEGGEYARLQAAHFDEEDDEFETERPHGTTRLYRWLIEEKFRRSIDGIAGLVPGCTALAVCGGSGMDAELLARASARVVSADISLGASRRARERARRFGLDVVPVVADAENLPFADRSFDLVYVHDGLHHLEHPEAGLAEMARVARLAVSITEPARAAATRLAVRIGLALDREEAGNRVARLDPAEVAALLRARGLDVVRAERYGMLYRHHPGAPSRLLSRERLFPLTVAALRAANAVAGPLGNKMTVQAVRRSL
ncbi:MAG: methyltransferase domain-containing protein [Actinobacteria bacterium]|nr:methyltransferase domain-containing protein [Actinomycetota bacterium]